MPALLRVHGSFALLRRGKLTLNWHRDNASCMDLDVKAVSIEPPLQQTFS